MEKKCDNVYKRLEDLELKTEILENRTDLNKYRCKRLRKLEGNFKVLNLFVHMYVIGRFVSWFVKEE